MAGVQYLRPYTMHELAVLQQAVQILFREVPSVIAMTVIAAELERRLDVTRRGILAGTAPEPAEIRRLRLALAPVVKSMVTLAVEGIRDKGAKTN